MLFRFYQVPRLSYCLSASVILGHRDGPLRRGGMKPDPAEDVPGPETLRSVVSGNEAPRPPVETVPGACGMVDRSEGTVSAGQAAGPPCEVAHRRADDHLAVLTQQRAAHHAPGPYQAQATVAATVALPHGESTPRNVSTPGDWNFSVDLPTGRIGASQWSTLVRTILELILGPLPLMAGRDSSRGRRRARDTSHGRPSPEAGRTRRVGVRDVLPRQGQADRDELSALSGLRRTRDPRPLHHSNSPRKGPFAVQPRFGPGLVDLVQPGRTALCR